MERSTFKRLSPTLQADKFNALTRVAMVGDQIRMGAALNAVQAALGAALAAAAVAIHIDVNGIVTADPRIVPAASTIESGSYMEICLRVKKWPKKIKGGIV